MTLNQKERKKIIDLWNSGLNVPAIAKIMNRWENTVRNILRKEGLYPRLYNPSGYAQQGLPKLITFYHGNQPWQQPTPQQIYQQQIAAEQGSKLIHELDKRNRENEDLKQKMLQVTTEKETLQDKFDKLIDAFGKIEEDHQRELEQKKKDNEELKQQRTNLTDELKLKNNKINEIQETADRRFEEMLKILQDQQSKLEELRDRDTTRELYLQENRNTLQRLNDGVKVMIAKIADQEKIIKTITDERNKFKEKLESVEREHESDWMLNLVIALVSFLGGIIADRTVLPKIKDFILSWGAEHGINTKDYANLFPSVNVIKPDIHHTQMGGTSSIRPNGMQCPNVVFNNNRGNPGTGYNHTLNQQDGAIPDIQGTSSDITTSINISDTTQSTGIDRNNHKETVELRTTFQMPQATSHFVPPPAMTPVYFSYFFTPIPNDLVEPYGWIPIKKMNWMQSTSFICWFFEQLGYKIIHVKKSHDKGGDILLERFGEILVIQVKHRKENTGIDALKDVLFGKKMYNATKAMVISFGSPFTRDAPKDAEKAGIELWNLERVITEVRNRNIGYPIE